MWANAEWKYAWERSTGWGSAPPEVLAGAVSPGFEEAGAAVALCAQTIEAGSAIENAAASGSQKGDEKCFSFMILWEPKRHKRDGRGKDLIGRPASRGGG